MTLTEKKIRDLCSHYADWYPSVSQIRELIALAQPSQEPVAFDVWLQECESMTMAVRHGVKFLLMPEESAVRIGTAIQNTTPPQRKPLTNEQMFKIWLTVPAETEDRFAFARAIEAAHGIKE